MSQAVDALAERAIREHWDFLPTEPAVASGSTSTMDSCPIFRRDESPAAPSSYTGLSPNCVAARYESIAVAVDAEGGDLPATGAGTARPGGVVPVFEPGNRACPTTGVVAGTSRVG